jgi:hypothetical protein
MTPRSIRRAAERKAQKLARNAENQSVSYIPAAAVAAQEETAPVSSAQLAANRANAQLSTGPKTAQGRAKASLNAVKSALTGRTVVLPTDDAAEYERHILAYEKQFKPVGPEECALVQSLADIRWRLNRIPGLEMAIYAVGRGEFADTFPEHDAASRPGLIDLQIFMKYEKQLRNLQLQEARLARRREKEMAELRQLQQERLQKETQEREKIAQRGSIKNGFEFSPAESLKYSGDEALVRNAETEPGALATHYAENAA